MLFCWFVCFRVGMLRLLGVRGRLCFCVVFVIYGVWVIV